MYNNNILVTTVIPSYNQISFLEWALSSVLSQSHQKQQIIIVNDYPDIEHRDSINELIKLDDRIEIVHNEQNKGIAASKNIWVQYSNGEYIAFLDHDDIRKDSDKIKNQLWVLLKNRDMALLWTRYDVINSEEQILNTIHNPCSDQEIRNALNFYCPLLQSTLMMPKQAIQKVWLYNEKYSMSDDYEIIFKMWKLWKLWNISDVSTSYRVHKKNTTKSNQKIMSKNALRILKEHGKDYPNYYKALLFTLLVKQPYRKIKCFLPEEFDVAAKNFTNCLVKKI